MNKKNIILVSVFFSPNRHIAVNRIESYAKYLAVDHNVTVITMGDSRKTVRLKTANGDSFKVHYLPNEGFFTSLLFYTGREGWFKHKFKTLVRIMHNKFNVSHFAGWSKQAEKKITQELESQKVEALISSYAPEDVLEVSYQALKNSLNTKTKWVLDMRDEYSDELGLSAWVKKQRQANEIRYSKRANLVLSVSSPLVEQFKKRMPRAKNFMEVRNGFDHTIKADQYLKSDKLKIGYFGSLHGEAKPYSFFKAIIELNIVDDVEIYFATRSVTFLIPKELREVVKFYDFMPYEESIKKMNEMDANLLILPSKIRVGVFSGKVFDYISSRRSILALVNPVDVAAKLVEETCSGYIADFDNLDDIKSAIHQLYSDWNNNKLKQPSSVVVARQHRKYQINKLNNWLVENA